MCLIHNEICHPEIRKIWEKQVQFIKISCFFQGKDKLDFFFFVCYYSPINLFADAPLIGPLLEQKNKPEFSEWPEQKISSDGSSICWMAKPGLARIPVLSAGTPEGLSPSSSGMLSPTPEGWGLSYPGSRGISSTSTPFSFQCGLVGTITTWPVNYSITKPDTGIILG